MTVQTLDAVFKYPATNVNKVRECREEINYKVIALATLYLPALADELNRLQKELDATHTQAFRTITQVPAILQSSALFSLIDTVQSLQSDHPTANQKSALESIYGEMESLIYQALKATMVLSTDLNNNLANFKAVTLSDNRFRIRELETEIANSSSARPEEQGAIEKLEDDEKKLNEAIKIIEAISTFDLIKDALLSAERLAGLNLADPKVELVKAGIAAASKILGLVADSVKYDSLIAARRQVQQKLDSLRSNLTKVDQEIKALKARLTQLTELQTVQTLRNEYANEIKTLADGTDKFLEITKYRPGDKLETVVKTFIEQQKAFSKHLNDLRSAWRS